ncbi:profilin-2-like [Limulus polyphemus]|uniref:Profilin n=1 Tax=Limulus polyphemus TaxID=6850 RepID=A0ABM1TK63_LIMPO|nr:profilin-2-like [Limulus polyphemus]
MVSPVKAFTPKYVDDQICSQVQCRLAVIAELAHGGILAKRESDPNTQIAPSELKVTVDTMKFNPVAFSIGGEKCICLSAESTLHRGRKEGSVLCIVATEKCLIASVTADRIPGDQLNLVVEKLGDYLRLSGY